MVDLKPHNKENYQKIKQMFQSGKKICAISQATGTGKTYLIAKLCEDYADMKKIIIAPNNYILDQTKEKFTEYGITKTDFMTYQKLIKMKDEEISDMDLDLIVLDEFHHTTSKVWGEKVDQLLSSHTGALIFGTSATPVRTDGTNTIDAVFNGNCVYELPLAKAIVEKIVPMPKYIASLYTLDDELEKLRDKVKNSYNTPEEKKELHQKIDAMRSQIEKSYGVPIILNRHIPDKQGKYIVFCKNRSHLKQIKDTVIEWFQTAGFKNIRSYFLYSDYEENAKDYKAFVEDTSNNLKLLFSVNMLNEGLHLDGISGVLLLRPTRSNIIFNQQVGRCIDAANTKMPVILDLVNNFNSVGYAYNLKREIIDEAKSKKDEGTVFNTNWIEDIDTFFITEYIEDSIKLFENISCGLKDGFERGLEHLDKYIKEYGDTLVPHGYVCSDGFALGNWCCNKRFGYRKELLAENIVEDLNDRKFVWNTYQERFKKQVEEIKQYIVINGKFPSKHSKNYEEKNLGCFLSNQKHKFSIKGEEYPMWKKQLLNSIDGFYFNNKKDSFNRFYELSIRYKKRFGHLNIKYNEIFSNVNIGNLYYRIKSKYINNELTTKQIELLRDLGVVFEDKFDKRRKKYLNLISQLAKKRKCIKSYGKYSTLYSYINNYFKINKDSLTTSEIKDICIVMGCGFEEFGRRNNSKCVEVFDNNGNSLGIFRSCGQLAKLSEEKFGVKFSQSCIREVCKGNYKQYKKYTFKYVDEDTQIVTGTKQ